MYFTAYTSTRRLLNCSLLKYSIYISHSIHRSSSYTCHEFLKDYLSNRNHSILWNGTRCCTSNAKKDVTSVSRKSQTEIQTDVKFSVKETTKTVTYMTVIIFGVSLTAIFFYVIFRELFSRNSPSGIYSTAFNKCCDDTRVQDALGLPIKGYGNENRMGRRRHVSHVKYLQDNVPHIRMIFYLKGSRNKGTVYLDTVENPSGNYEFRYLFVQVQDMARRVIILADNRSMSDSNTSPMDDFIQLNTT